MSNRKVNYYDRRNELVELAYVDEADDYEVDEAGLYLDKDCKVILLTASGCSCWDSDEDWNEESYDNLEHFREKMMTDGEVAYNPSLSRVQQLYEMGIANFIKARMSLEIDHVAEKF